MTVIEKQVPSSDGKHLLQGKLYLPDGKCKGYFHVVHGMTEHIGRYDSFMRLMAEDGFLCFGYDHIGHGKTARKGEYGFFAHRDGWRLLVEDVARFSEAVMTEYGKEKPYVLMGHSMGSFIVRLASVMTVKPDCLIVMGTGGPNPLSGVGIALAGAVKTLRGDRYISKLLYHLVFGTYGERFEGTEENRWLTKNEEIRKEYAADPYCRFRFCVSALQDLIRLNRFANLSRTFKATGQTPVLLVSGTDDPVGDYGKGVQKVYEKFSDAGTPVTACFYDGCRHEILNDTCREQVITDIRAFLSFLA